MRSARRYGGAIGFSLSVAIVLIPFREQLGSTNILLLFVAASVAVALLFGSGPAVIASVAGFLLVDYLFIEPYYNLTVAAAHYFAALIIYLVVSLIVGQLVVRLRDQTREAQEGERRVEMLYEMNLALIGDVKLTNILSSIVERVVNVFGAHQARILLPEALQGMSTAGKDGPVVEPDLAGDPADSRLVVRVSYPQNVEAISSQTLALARWVMRHRQPAGRQSRRDDRPWSIEYDTGSMRPTSAPPYRWPRLYLPIATRERSIGVLEVTRRPGDGAFTDDDEQILGTFAAQVALALDRARLTQEAARSAVLRQSDELKSALLSAVSHDLRTPLASIKAAATSLLDEQVDWKPEDRREFLTAINEEADRLTMLVDNLLDLSRIEGGALRPDPEWYDVLELLEDVAGRLRARSDTPETISVQVDTDLPPVWFDYVEIAQVLMNLGENALKYTPSGSSVILGAQLRNDMAELSVADSGPGIAASVQPRLFERFYRGDAQASTVSGSGIGLAICKGLVEANGGQVGVESAPGKGARFWLTLPVTAPAPIPPVRNRFWSVTERETSDVPAGERR